MSDYVIRFKAWTLTNGTLRVVDEGAEDIDKNITLNTTPTFYEYTFHSSKSQWFAFGVVSGDVRVKDIELVQKPLPKNTINGIDGFNSGKWTIYGDYQIVDDETLVINSTGNYHETTLYVPVMPNQTYTVNFEGNGKMFLETVSTYGVAFDGGQVIRGDSYPGVFTFTITSSVAKYLRLVLTNSNMGIGQFTFKRLMLNVGTIPAPYSKKTGDKMVKPTPKKNLVLGFKSGAWSLHANAKVVDDETLELNATADYQASTLIVPVASKTITLSMGASSSGSYLQVTGLNSSSFVTGSSSVVFANQSLTVTLPFDAVKIQIDLSNNEGAKKYTFSKPMITLGSIIENHEPYKVQLNPKTKKYISKKNMFDFIHENIVSLMGTEAVIKTDSYVDLIVPTGGYGVRYVRKLPVKRNTNYTFNSKYTVTNGVDNFGCGWRVHYVNEDIYSAIFKSSTTINSGANDFIELYLYGGLPASSDTTVRFTDMQFEEGLTATTYEPYQQVLPRAKSGLSFNKDGFIQLPSMTMDSIEIDCLIDVGHTTTEGNASLFDARPSLDESWFETGYAIGTGWSSYYVDGVLKTDIPMNVIPFGKRFKLKAIAKNVFTGGVKVFSAWQGSYKPKAILYKVTCYLAGNVVASYDFTNPSNIVGNTIMQNAKNLIPSFEDSRWSLPLGSQVIGKDVLRYVTTNGWSTGWIFLDSEPNKTYKLRIDVISNNCAIEYDLQDKDKVRIFANAISHNGEEIIFTTPNNTRYVKINVYNNSNVGTFDFIKPQLYELDGKQGTINGSPVPQRKASRRTQYAKR